MEGGRIVAELTAPLMSHATEDAGGSGGGGGGGGDIDRDETDELVFEKEVLWFQSSSYRWIYYLSKQFPNEFMAAVVSSSLF